MLGFRELYADMPRASDGSELFGIMQFPLGTPARRSVAHTFPRTDCDASTSAQVPPFRVRAALVITVS